MNHTQTLITGLISAACLTLPLAAFAQEAGAKMSRDQYQSAKDSLDARYKADKAKCESLNNNAEDICEDEAEGRHNVAKAELEYQRSGKPEDARKVEEAKTEATYEVAKERCDDLAGNPKDVCIADAKAAHAKAKANISTAAR